MQVVSRKRLLDALCSDLSVLNASIASTLAGGTDDEEITALQRRWVCASCRKPLFVSPCPMWGYWSIRGRSPPCTGNVCGVQQSHAL